MGKVRLKVRFVIENDVLYAVNEEQKRLLVPTECKSMVMHLANTFPWAGHLGCHKTHMQVSARFLLVDHVHRQKYCSTCPTCQKTSITETSDRAFLQPLSITSTNFCRIAMDIVGPLVKSSGGHQYILVLCDYAKCFPKAFPL